MHINLMELPEFHRTLTKKDDGPIFFQNLKQLLSLTTGSKERDRLRNEAESSSHQWSAFFKKNPERPEQ